MGQPEAPGVFDLGVLRTPRGLLLAGELDLLRAISGTLIFLVAALVALASSRDALAATTFVSVPKPRPLPEPRPRVTGTRPLPLPPDLQPPPGLGLRLRHLRHLPHAGGTGTGSRHGGWLKATTPRHCPIVPLCPLSAWSCPPPPN
ncbi:uncharacterized protein [Agelaius tricolor]|uniref:uncharacterized protein isoform X2 n=1 Tax=Agelaius tricolor TaxID=9191 RepID=UPI0039F24182